MTAIAFVAASVGITVVPRLCTKGLREGVVAIPVTNPTPTRTVLALVNHAAEHAGPVEVALEELRRCALEATAEPPARTARLGSDCGDPQWPSG